jgi:hypothetical protein
MTILESPHLDTGRTQVTGFLAIVGALAYAAVGGPLIVAGGLAIGLALIAYRRVHA